VKILLLGANGQVGREIPEAVEQSEDKSIEVIALDRGQLDITQETIVSQQISAIRPSIVINAAAYTAVDKAEKEPELAFAVNRDAAVYIAKACSNNNIPLIHISTDYVFDGEKEGAYQEEDAVNPQSVYGQSKWEGEEAVRNSLKQHIILRTSWVFGVYGKNFVYTMIRLARQKEELRVVNDQYGCPTSAASIASALVAISLQIDNGENKSWGTYHYCGKPETTWYQFAKTIIDTSKDKLEYKVKNVVPISTDEFPTPARRPQNSTLDCDKFRSVFHVEQADWKQDLQAMLEHEHFMRSVQ
jgi:dTDP-4-dehydrorhamnose reductase